MSDPSNNPPPPPGLNFQPFNHLANSTGNPFFDIGITIGAGYAAGMTDSVQVGLGSTNYYQAMDWQRQSRQQLALLQSAQLRNRQAEALAQMSLGLSSVLGSQNIGEEEREALRAQMTWLTGATPAQLLASPMGDAVLGDLNFFRASANIYASGRNQIDPITGYRSRGLATNTALSSALIDRFFRRVNPLTGQMEIDPDYGFRTHGFSAPQLTEILHGLSSRGLTPSVSTNIDVLGAMAGQDITLERRNFLNQVAGQFNLNLDPATLSNETLGRVRANQRLLAAVETANAERILPEDLGQLDDAAVKRLVSNQNVRAFLEAQQVELGLPADLNNLTAQDLARMQQSQAGRIAIAGIRESYSQTADLSTVDAETFKRIYGSDVNIVQALKEIQRESNVKYDITKLKPDQLSNLQDTADIKDALAEILEELKMPESLTDLTQDQLKILQSDTRFQSALAKSPAGRLVPMTTEGMREERIKEFLASEEVKTYRRDVFAQEQLDYAASRLGDMRALADLFSAANGREGSAEEWLAMGRALSGGSDERFKPGEMAKRVTELMQSAKINEVTIQDSLSYALETENLLQARGLSGLGGDVTAYAFNVRGALGTGGALSAESRAGWDQLTQDQQADLARARAAGAADSPQARRLAALMRFYEANPDAMTGQALKAARSIKDGFAPSQEILNMTDADFADMLRSGTGLDINVVYGAMDSARPDLVNAYGLVPIVANAQVNDIRNALNQRMGGRDAKSSQWLTELFIKGGEILDPRKTPTAIAQALQSDTLPQALKDRLAAFEADGRTPEQARLLLAQELDVELGMALGTDRRDITAVLQQSSTEVMNRRIRDEARVRVRATLDRTFAGQGASILDNLRRALLASGSLEGRSEEDIAKLVSEVLGNISKPDAAAITASAISYFDSEIAKANEVLKDPSSSEEAQLRAQAIIQENTQLKEQNKTVADLLNFSDVMEDMLKELKDEQAKKDEAAGEGAGVDGAAPRKIENMTVEGGLTIKVDGPVKLQGTDGEMVITGSDREATPQ